jgi:hypothetical protein
MIKTNIKVLQTSVPNSQELSLSIKGALLTITTMLALLGYKDVVDVNTTTELFVNVILEIFAIINAGITLFGLLRRTYYWVIDLINKFKK